MPPNGGVRKFPLTKSSLAHHLASLPGLDRGELRQRWLDLFSSPAPNIENLRLFRHEIARRIQVAMFGDVDQRTRRQLVALSHDARTLNARSPSMLPTGTVIIKDWRGRQYRVEVTGAGYLFDGRIFSSLSAISRSITGTTWSGPRFFGLRRSKQSASE